jgi:TonB family protein
MADARRRTRKGRRGADGSFLRAAALSALLHTVAIALVLLAPHRLRSAPPTAYTVEIVDPGALGGKLLAGPIGGGAPGGRRPPSSQQPAPPPERPRQEPAPPERSRPEPEVVAKAEPPEPAPPRVEDADTVPLALARPAPQPTRQAEARPTPTAPPKPRPTATVAVTPKPLSRPSAAATVKPAASPASGVRRVSPSPVASPKVEEREKRDGKEAPRPSPASGKDAGERGQPTPADLDSQLAAAIKGVESRVEKVGTQGQTSPGGGMGGTGGTEGTEGTERTLDRPPGVGGEGPGGGGTLRGLEFIAYYNQMLSRIKESWAYVGDRADLQVTVRFSILESGEITDIRLVERSGDPGYDASVERAVKRASPLGPPPEAYRKEFADVELTFRPADLRRPPG